MVHSHAPPKLPSSPPYCPADLVYVHNSRSVPFWQEGGAIEREPCGLWYSVVERFQMKIACFYHDGALEGVRHPLATIVHQKHRRETLARWSHTPAGLCRPPSRGWGKHPSVPPTPRRNSAIPIDIQQPETPNTLYVGCGIGTTL